MYSVKELYRPTSLEEALRLMGQKPEKTPMAGGTDVIVKMRSKQPEDVTILALGKITDQEFHSISVEEDGTIKIGAFCTFTEVANCNIIEQEVPCLKSAALSMGGPQIQNMATIGGNVCNGAVSADSAPSLFALDARLVLRSLRGERVVPIADFYLGPGRTDRKTDELLIQIIIPPREKRFGCIYHKFATRKAMDLAILGVAAGINTDENGCITHAAIALGVAAPVPVRCKEAEDYLTGKYLTEEIAEEAGSLALKAAKPRDSWRASKRYREALIETLSSRAVASAYHISMGEEAEPSLYMPRYTNVFTDGVTGSMAICRPGVDYD